MGNVIVEGGSATIMANPPCVLTPTPIPVSLMCNSSDKLKGESKKTLLKSDMEGQTAMPSIPYIAPPYVIPGVVSWDGKMSGSQESEKLKKSGSGVVIDDTNQGDVEFQVVTPAQQPGSPPTPDPNTKYQGKWTLVMAGQTKLVAKS